VREPEKTNLNQRAEQKGKAQRKELKCDVWRTGRDKENSDGILDALWKETKCER
jgi:hypothetical protein